MRVYELRLLAREKGVAEKVIFVTDAPWSDVQAWLGRAWAGVNAMWNEHFGIGVVEYLAAGLVGVVHNSGGPKLDIVVEGTGMIGPSSPLVVYLTLTPPQGTTVRRKLNLPSLLKPRFPCPPRKPARCASSPARPQSASTRRPLRKHG